MKIKKAGLFIVMGGMLCLSFCEAQPIVVANASSPVVSIYGEAKKEFEPDEATIYARVEISNVSEVADEVKSQFAEIKDNLSEAGATQINATFFYDSSCCYDGQMIYKSTLDFFADCGVDNLIDCVKIVDGFENVKLQSIAFKINGDDAYNEVLSLATDNAKEKAKTLLNTNDLEVEQIEEICHYYCGNSYYDYAVIDYENLIQNVTVEAKVKMTLKYADVEEEK